MLRTCPRCSRVNPAEALFCYEDGSPLAHDGIPGRGPGAAAKSFPFPFVFPSGRSCRTFDELALALLDDMAATFELLQNSVLTNFFAGLGRADLSAVARSAARSPDLSQALDRLVEHLPTQILAPPKLHLAPAQVNLGALSVGQERTWELHLVNQGMRLLRGSVRCDCFWLSVGEGAGASRKLFECFQEMRLPVHVRTRQLRAQSQPLEGRLVIETNGGNATVLVGLELPIQPFPPGVLAGATTPREVAQKAKAAPAAAAPLFEQGEVARWYESNGWTYPVQGPSAAGLGAVQQFFEALGLTSPPRVEINTQTLSLKGRPGDQLSESLRLWTQEKRPIYAHAVSPSPWLRVGAVKLEGRFAGIEMLAVVPDRPGETLHTTLTVIANGNQRFPVSVALEVGGRRSAVVGALAAPEAPEVLEVLPARPSRRERTRRQEPVLDVLPADEEPRPRRRRMGARVLLHALPAVFLALGIMTALVHDLVTRALHGGPDTSAATLIAIQFHDKDEVVELGSGGGVKAVDGGGNTRLATWEGSMRFGLVTRGSGGGGLWPLGGGSKRLTFDEQGRTNNTCIRLDGRELLFGERPFRLSNGQTIDNWPGRWQERSQPTAGEGRQSVWVYDNEQVFITQTVELVAGEQSGVQDTCLVRYRIENRDGRPHNVGLRFLLDTYIGSNDGVPFLIPGARRLCDTMLDLRTAEEIPAYLQALEKEDLADPGTVVQVRLKVGGGLEAPGRVTLGAWPDPQLRSRDPRCKQEKTLWEVPVLPIKTLRPGDSAVTMYWLEQVLPPGGKRDVGFACGLGSVSGGESKGQLGLTLGGSFTPGGELDLTAYVPNPTAGQTVTLTLPEGLTLLGSKPEQPVPPLPANAATRFSPVTWRVQPGQEGEYNLSVSTSTGATQTKRVVIKSRGIFGS
jgi:hypothetical protein